MRSAEILNEMRELREEWRKQSFLFSIEQQKRYDHLLDMRRSRVKYFHDNDLVSKGCLLYTSPSPRDAHESRMPSSA